MRLQFLHTENLKWFFWFYVSIIVCADVVVAAVVIIDNDCNEANDARLLPNLCNAPTAMKKTDESYKEK